MTTFKIFPFCQLLYYFLTALWPLIHIESFLTVTGKKTDIWLVKTVGIILLPYCLLLIYLTFSSKKNFVMVLTLMLGCLGLLFVDLYYYFRNIIKWVYLIDGFFQLLFFTYWTFYIARYQ
ncbi:hypothetical protein SAMN05421594_2707 [Chryseobacterium oleae]|uniref:Uncharacterized protein n=1 Tax=Chryseobacterium oleae TaxID=491207 RepID=A0A1I4YV49_CHROL|nr:hypothetical protein SAMN05421594_2707 [Chryseobacterium oleae]